VQQSRKVFFYTGCEVADTLDGRFDVIILHVFLELLYLRSGARPGVEREKLGRFLQESLFDDMDRSLREMGVGDMGVARRIQNMSKASYGRLEAYTKAYGDTAAMNEALLRNIYRGVQPSPKALAALGDYVQNYRPLSTP